MDVHTYQWIADTYRTIVILVAGGAMATSMLIAYKYERAYRQAKRDGGEWRRLLPRHVRNISIAHTLALGWLTIEVAQRIGSPTLTSRSTFLLLLSLYTLYALMDVARYRQRKVQERVEEVRRTVDEETIEAERKSRERDA